MSARVSGTAAKARERFPFQEGIMYMKFVERNVFLTLTDLHSKPYLSASIGCYGYKNAAKKTPTAIEDTVKHFLSHCSNKGIRVLDLKVKGVNRQRKSAMRKLGECTNITFLSIEDRTSTPFGGCRPKKANLRKGGY